VSISCDPADLVKAAKCFSCVPKSARRWVRTYLLCQYGVKVTGLTFGQQTANDWARRVVVNGGPAPSQNSINAVTVFADTLNNAGLWSKMIHINVIAPDSINAFLTPLLVGGGNDPYPGVCGNNNATTLGLTINGVKANGGNSAAENTGIVAINVFASDTSAGITIYVSQNSLSEAAQDAGYIRSSDNGANFAMYTNIANVCYFLCWDGANGQCASPYPGGFTGNGYFSGNRTAANVSKVYCANSITAHQQIGSIATMGGTRQNAPAYAFDAYNITGPGCGTLGNKRYSFLAFHQGLQQSESLTLFNAVQALRTAFGGGFV